MEGDVYATAGATIHRTITLPKDKELVPAMFGSSVALEGDLGRYGGAEVTLAYLHKNYMVKRNDLALVERVRRASITTSYRHWFHSRIALAVGLASSYTMGDPDVISDEIQDPVVHTTARDIVEYGLDVSMLSEIWAEGSWAVVADLRYLLSFASLQGERADVYSAMLGMKYLVPKRKLKGG